MAEYERRFKGFAQEEKVRCIAELEAQIAERGAGILSADDVEELLLLLPANYFKRLFRRRVLEILRRAKGFAALFADMNNAAEKLVEDCRWKLDSERDGDAEDALLLMDQLRIIDPALWFLTYRKLKALSLSMAIKLEPSDKTEPFEKP